MIPVQGKIKLRCRHTIRKQLQWNILKFLLLRHREEKNCVVSCYSYFSVFVCWPRATSWILFRQKTCKENKENRLLFFYLRNFMLTNGPLNEFSDMATNSSQVICCHSVTWPIFVISFPSLGFLFSVEFKFLTFGMKCFKQRECQKKSTYFAFTYHTHFSLCKWC